MTEHEETAKQILPCQGKFVAGLKMFNCPGENSSGVLCENCRRRPAVAAALAQAEAKGVRIGLKRARMIVASRVFADGEKSCNCDVEMRDRLDAEIAKAEGKSPA